MLIYNHYKEDFWEIFVDYQLIKKTTVPQFQDFIERNNVYIVLLLQEKPYATNTMCHLRKFTERAMKNFELFRASMIPTRINVIMNFPIIFRMMRLTTGREDTANGRMQTSNYLLQLSLWSSHHQKKIDDRIILKAKKG